ALLQVSNASVILVDEVRTAVQVSTAVLQNISSAMSSAVMDLSSIMKGVNAVIPGAIANTSKSLQTSIDMNSPAVHFALIALGIFLIASTIFCLCGAVYKGAKAARFIYDWCKKGQTPATRSRTPPNQGDSARAGLLDGKGNANSLSINVTRWISNRPRPSGDNQPKFELTSFSRLF
uniref:Uncharacterized protein n=1 Tax=Plectus sambesii TaxID=2011161 RepID=A0A914WJV9_9BILA